MTQFAWEQGKECSAQRVNKKCQLWTSVINNCNKCATRMQDGNNRGDCWGAVAWELSRRFTQFFSKSKIAHNLSINLRTM